MLGEGPTRARRRFAPRAVIAMHAAAALTCAAAAGDAVRLAVTTSGPPRLSVVEVADLSLLEVDGLKLRELSGLGWSEDDQVLYAVSDKGVLFHLVFDGATGRLADLKPVHAVRLREADGRPIDRPQANAEGLAVRNGSNGVLGDDELVVALETGPRLSRFSRAGVQVGDLPVAEALRANANLQAESRGLEAVALHPALGAVTIPERPLATARKDRHDFYTEDGKWLSFPALNGGKGRVKAVEILPDGQLLVLERMRIPETDRHRSVPRLLDPEACDAGVCEPRPLDIAGEDIPDGNFEGLARLSRDLFIAVSDEIVAEKRRTRFVLFRIDGAER